MQASDEEAAQLQEVQQVGHGGDPADVDDMEHPAEAQLLPGGAADFGNDADGSQQVNSETRRLMNDGPPQPQLTIVVNSLHRLVSGETDSQFHNGGVDANDADDELEGPLHGGRHAANNGGRGGGRHHHHTLRRHGSASAYAGPATSATGIGGRPDGAAASSRAATAEREVEADLLGGMGAPQGDVAGPSGLVPQQRGESTGAGAGQRRRGEKRKRASQQGIAESEGSGSASGAGSE